MRSQTRLSGLLLAILFFALLPTVAAQVPPVATDAIAIEVGAHATPIPTESDVDIPYTVTYTVGAPSTGALPLRILPDAPAGWLVVAVPDHHATPDAPSPPATYTFEGVIRARHDGTPRAFRADTISVLAASDGDGRLVQPRSASAETTLSADWEPGLQVVIQVPGVQLSRSDNIGLAMGEIRNTGNAPVDVAAIIRSAPEGCQTKIEKAQQTIEPGERGTLAIDVECTPAPDSGRLVVTLRHTLAGDASRQGEPVEPTWDIGNALASGGPRTFGDEPDQTRYDSSWGAVVLVPAALALAALARRRT